MLKKNQLALILLTLVLMLSIYYIKSPFGNDGGSEKPNDNPDLVTSGRLEELTAMRISLREERELQILTLDEIIASDEATVAQKNIALNEKNYINSLTEKELLMEQSIINSGYQDAFVHASSYGVNITVVSNENSILAATKILKEAKQEFHELESVIVQFKTAAEVSGNASAS